MFVLPIFAGLLAWLLWPRDLLLHEPELPHVGRVESADRLARRCGSRCITASDRPP